MTDSDKSGASGKFDDQQATPGPWYMPRGPYITKRTGEGEIFSGGDWCVTPPLGEAGPVAIVNGEANARLIAAAWDLLELVKLFEKSVEYEIRRSKNGDEECARLKTVTLNIIRGVVAKATGATT